MRLKLAIVILNWNGRKFLEQFLQNLIAQTPDWAEVVVADNASTDNSIPFLQSHFPNVRIIQNDKNYGFAQGYNVALAQLDCDFYCLLNSDIEVLTNLSARFDATLGGTGDCADGKRHEDCGSAAENPEFP